MLTVQIILCLVWSTVYGYSGPYATCRHAIFLRSSMPGTPNSVNGMFPINC